MVAINEVGTDIRKRHGVAVLEQLAFMVDRLDPWRLVRWLLYKTPHAAAMREFDRLSDYYLDDVGAKRRVDVRTDDLVSRLRWGG